MFTRIMVLRTIGSKIPITPRGGRFFEENFLRYLGSCHFNPAYHKLNTLIPSIISCELIRNFKKLLSQYLSLLG